MQINESFVTQNRTFSNPQRIVPRGIMIHSVGTPQPRADVFVRNLNTQTAQTSWHAIVDAKGNVTQTLEWTMRAWHAGGGANNTHIGVEMTEPATIRYTTGANFVDNDPVATREHVRATYQTAVALFAKLCIELSLNPLADGVIISHSEGFRRGIASNHADVEHLWGRFGLSMSQFRQDVAEEIQKKQTVEVAVVQERFQTLEEIPTWARQVVEKLQHTSAADGLPVLRGDGAGNLDLSLDMLRMLVMMERLMGARES